LFLKGYLDFFAPKVGRVSANLQPILNKHFARQTQVVAADKLDGIHPGERKVIVMQYEEQQLINGLFERLKQTGQQNSQRDADAERQIAEFVRQQPAAPYYMAQSILIQEAALKRLQARVQELESELAAQKANPRRAAVFSAACLVVGKATRSRTTAGMPSRNSHRRRIIHGRQRRLRLLAAAVLWQARSRQPLAWPVASCWPRC
jgi:hypothetical protein